MADNKRRVLILSEIMSPYRIPVFNALAQHQAVDLHVVFLAETDAGLRQWRIYKDEICFSYDVLPSWRFRAGRHKLLLNWGLRSCLKRFAPNTVICGGYSYFASWAALSWARRHHVDFVLWSESNSNDARREFAWVESMKSNFLARCHRFVVPGKASLSYLQTMGLAEKNITVAPNAVDNNWFAAQSDSVRVHSSEFREKLGVPSKFILFVGRLVREKGIFDLLDAYGKLEDSIRASAGLVFAGDGECRLELEQLAKQVHPGRICFPGFVHREDLAGLYALAEALVLPTHSDTWGLVVNEAMACSLPIVVTSVAGCAADLVEDEWNGYVVLPRNPRALKVAIERLLLNPELRPQMSVRSCERIRNYSPEACAAGLAAVALSAGGQSQ
ncbi:MAG: glycosyltransferase family 4 protein [Terriglobales bacterium]